jgi:hypothetical protein
VNPTAWCIATLAAWVGASGAEPTPLTSAHAHNDYAHTRPLLDALDHGFCSIEADIWLVDGRLLVAHNRGGVRPERTLRTLYLDPLRRRILGNGGRLYSNGPPCTLLIDVKSEARGTYLALRDLLQGYTDILTVFTPTNTVTNALTIVLSGNRPTDILADEVCRLAAIEGRLTDLPANPSPHLVPLIGDHWARNFRWRGKGPLPEEERQKLRRFVAQAHQQGRRIRFWAAPDTPAGWRELHEAGVDLINTDDLAGLRRWLLDSEPASFEGRFFRGAGDPEYLRLLETARRLFAPDPELQNLSMLYLPTWNGLVEGPTWDAWWIQNSYGTTYSALPFLEEPFVTFLQNSQDLWFDQMGDGQRVGAAPPFDWVAPDGCLCDAARPGWIVYRQGDGRPQIHDWGMEFTAAGLLLQSELLLIGRDRQAIARYLPKLERCARFIEARRDPTNNLFLAGPAGNLLAPSYAGWRKPDATYDQAYLTGLSITYLAALDRLIQIEKLAGRTSEAKLHTRHRESARRGLAHLTTDEGYLIRSLDPDGTRHGVFGAARHGYFETSPNHDAIAFRVLEDAQAEKIYAKIASIPGLRPHDFILPNYPSYDDMYEKPEGLWAFGTWVNGGHWSTCEARMMLSYYRLGKFDDARRSMRQLLTFAERFRMDNPLVKCGSDVYQPNQPINLTYDAFGPAAAFVRGLFEYLYEADELTLVPHVPPTITRLEQRFPIRFGAKRLYLASVGTGPITAVTLDGKAWRQFDAKSVRLPYAKLSTNTAVEIALGGAKLRGFELPSAEPAPADLPPLDTAWLRLGSAHASTNQVPPPVISPGSGGIRVREDVRALLASGERLRRFHQLLAENGLTSSYEATHARLALNCLAATHSRLRLLAEGQLKPLTDPVSQAAADQSYVDTTRKLADGLAQVLAAYEKSGDPGKNRIARLWRQSAAEGNTPAPPN